ncbi:MAG TPA: pantoate--beta-alanine ligase [Gammaproteobacteria bacterium]|jgi:pantoate--beta-alanine ligase|nr:pantoate--beta-alanine ligase [Gammaproteobacteria bacterium]
MNIVTEINAWQAIRKSLQQQTIGFIPTMGNLHAGHLSLCERSCAENNINVVSIFVNPMQFNQPEDFNQYPRTLGQDIALLSSLPIDYLLLPSIEALYPDCYQLQVQETVLSTELEGLFRPGHFTGMLTIVLKLLNLVMPTHVYFCEKDYQQLLLVKKLVQALFLPITVVACATIRAEDGLALSSRNARLTVQQRRHAAAFPRLLHSLLDTETISVKLVELGFKVEYIVEQWGRILGAVWLGDVRLIDNVAFSSRMAEK